MKAENTKEKKFSIKDLLKNISLVLSLTAIVVSGGICAMFGIKNNMLKTKNVELDKHNTQLSEQNILLDQQNSALNKQISDLNNVVDDLESTIDRYELQVSMVTYEVNGETWKAEIVQKGSEVRLQNYPDTATQVFRGWKIQGKDEIYRNYTVNESVKFVAVMENKDWVITAFNGPKNFSSNYIWNCGNNTYYSNFDEQYVLNPETSTWSKMEWNINITEFHVEKYGDSYYAFGEEEEDFFKLNTITNTWEKVEDIDHEYDNIYLWFSSYVWTVGDKVYSSTGNEHYVFNPESNTWSEKTWNGLENFMGSDIWTDGKDYYYSNSENQYYLDVETDTWLKMDWTGLTNFSVSNIWKMNGNYYYSKHDMQYVLDVDTHTWNTMVWQGLIYFSGEDIWENNGKYYWQKYSDSSEIEQYELDVDTLTWKPKYWNFENGCTLGGADVWSDGENYYVSNGTDQYILDVESRTWKPMVWNSNSDKINGTRIWSDGVNYYCSTDWDGTYILNKINNSWEPITWNVGISYDCIWVDGDKCYYSDGPKQYVLDRSTLTWKEQNWNGEMTSINGRCVWTDGEDYYYYENYEEYKLDRDTQSWVLFKERFSSYYGPRENSVFSISGKYYCIQSNRIHELDVEKHEWFEVNWIGLFSADEVSNLWTDGINTYCYSSHYKGNLVFVSSN